METLSYIILILLSLVGYSGGATAQSGKNTDLKPVILDLILVVLIWTTAIYSRLTYDFNKWLMILVWIGISAVVGIAAFSKRMGSFQSRILLSFFFFIFISPAALIIRVLGDPLLSGA